MRVQIKTWEKMARENAGRTVNSSIYFAIEDDTFTEQMEKFISKIPGRIIDVELKKSSNDLEHPVYQCYGNSIKMIFYPAMIERYLGDEITSDKIKIGKKFTDGKKVFLKVDEKSFYDIYNKILNPCDFTYDGVETTIYDSKLNLNWWEADYYNENEMTKIEIMLAHKDGAEIEFNKKKFQCLDFKDWQKCYDISWDWYLYNYRFVKKEKPKPLHKITIDGKEIELSEESYKELKKSLT